MVYDVAIIGAGVVGAMTARELSRYRLKICLLEKEADVGSGTSKANSAIVHAGYDARHGTLKSVLNVRGNEMMDNISKELAIPFKRIGSLVLAFNKEEMHVLRDLYDNGRLNNVPGLKLLGAEETKLLEPDISPDVIGSLYAPSAGIICPYQMTVGPAENAVENGAELMLESGVTDICRENGFYTIKTEKGEVRSRYIVNAAGVYSDFIARLAGDDEIAITPRKGEYMILDKNQGRAVNHVIFQPPTKMGKGILVTPTIHGNLLLGPTAADIDDKDDTDTTSDGLEQVIEGARKSVPSVRINDVITSFAGIRATPSTGDFIIKASGKAKGLIHAAGIESPGLTAAPAIAELVVKLLAQEGLVLEPKEHFNPIRKPPVRFAELSDEEKSRLIKENPMYGNIICRCETVTEGEIVDCIRRPAGARNLDAVKRRTRPGTGRCQGGFCTPRVVAILARELGISPEEVTKKGGDSKILAVKL